MENTTEPLENPSGNEIRLIDVPITDENIALNVLVSFLNVAQKRGTFSIAESAKIFECIQKFIQQQQQPSPAPQDSSSEVQPTTDDNANF
jgi:hypothetical protein